jgi:cytochrome c oxidase cbb3-type subunit 2
MAQSNHDFIERKVGWLIVFTLLTVSVGGLVEIVPLFHQKSTTTPVEGLKPYDPVRLVGRDIYIREGCYNCHSQMIRPFRAETERYGHYSVAGEYVYDHPFQWGSKRTGPDLHRVGGRYSDQWHRIHLLNPRDVVPESNMPAFPWLDRPAKIDDIEAKMTALRKVGVPYSDEDIQGARKALEGKTELEAVVAYLQGLGTALTAGKAAPAPAAEPAPVAAPAAAEALGKVFFEVGSSALPGDATAAVNAAAEFLKGKADAKIDVTGYTDKTGDVEKNLELAKERAKAVREALKAAGVAEDRINMKPPVSITGSGDNAEARRVELNPGS